MISSLLWIILVQVGYLNPEHLPWKIYLPVCLIEIIVYFKLLTKWGEND
jgi:hypothetical protein